MIKVIKEGNIPKYRVECIRCKSIIEYTDTDEIEKFCRDVAWFGNCTDWSIKCPICGTNTPTRSLTDEGSYDWRIKKEDKNV